MKTLMTGAALALTISGAALAENWTDWDTNADAGLDRTEFRAGLETDATFDTWDADADGMLTRDEFDEGMFSAFDADDDDILNEPEGVTLDAMRTGWDADESN